ncbi:MAG TPA: NAD(P)-dependent oxidoreductase [Candidatus Binatia bacterium]|jgi:UDP-glucose 4-epimerase|nr:NAD(P)-dependent oxidoreductase [Candidatus Binatia bacterium]
MRILFTGASSFSGFGFVQALTAGGHEVICPLRGSLEAYTGIRSQRAKLLRDRARLVPHAPFGGEAFLKLLRQGRPWDLLCHHAAEVGNYKSLDFDPFQALQNNTQNLRTVLDAFKQSGGKAVVLTGTIFEPDEGTGDEPLRAFSPYGLSKGLTWQTFRFYCGQANLPLGKFVMPNPFGPWEEPRFTSYLLNTWKEQRPAQVKTPDCVRDNIHLDLLAAVYAQFAGQVAGLTGGCIRSNPSGYVESLQAFTMRVAHEVRTRTAWPCEVELLAQTDFSEPMRRSNLDPAATLVPNWDEKRAWDTFVEFYNRSDNDGHPS